MQDIVESTVSDGSYGFEIPTDLAAGSGYTIKIKSVDDARIVGESNAFDVEGTIIVTAVSANTWLKGHNKTITWTDNISENVKIDLYKDGNFEQTVVASTESDGSYIYNVSTDLVVGADYKLRISSVNSATGFDESSSFEINMLITSNGKAYQVIKIGDQIWMAENLNDVSHTSGNSSCYDNDASNCTTYGRLYDWDAALDIASKVPGWHLPTDEEWTTLTNYLGGSNDAGTKLKSGGSSGFNALLAGLRYYNGSFLSLGEAGFFWSASPIESSYAWYQDVSRSRASLDRNNNYRSGRLSVRLLKD